jgi:hypothetical protein
VKEIETRLFLYFFHTGRIGLFVMAMVPDDVAEEMEPVFDALAKTVVLGPEAVAQNQDRAAGPGLDDAANGGTNVLASERHHEKAGGFSYHPPKGWVLHRFPSSYFQTVLAPSRRLGDGNVDVPSLHFSFNTIPISLDRYADTMVQIAPRSYPQYKNLARSELKTNKGQPVIKVVGTTVQQGRNLYLAHYMLAVGAKKKLDAKGKIHARDWEKWEPVLDEAIKTLEFQ